MLAFIADTQMVANLWLRPGNTQHDYKRHGTTTLFAAMRTLDGAAISRCAHYRKSFAPIAALVPTRTKHYISARTHRHVSRAEVLLEWGFADGLFVDGKQISTGPPLSYEKIYKRIAKGVKKLRISHDWNAWLDVPL